jgi:hypothetical protein
MPYQTGGTSQGESGAPEVQDVYRSGNVFANGVPVALHLPPGGDGSGTSLTFNTPSSKLFARPDDAPAADNPTYTPPPPGQAPTPDQNAQAGAKPGTPGDFPEDKGVQDQPESKCDGNKPSVVPFLTQCLNEAKNGTWRETGQGGRASNPNILNIWKNLGLNFSSDQVPWCAGFACFAMKQSGLKYLREAGARNLASKLVGYDPGYKDVTGQALKPGDLVLWSSGHVNFVYTANNGSYTFVGGNQAPGKAATPPVRDPQNDGDVTISWPGGWTSSRGGLVKAVRLDC